MKYLLTIFLFSLTSYTLIGQNDEISNQFERAVISGDLVRQKALASTIGAQYSPHTLAYYKLVFNQLPSNAILITNANDDTFPIKVLQLTKNMRPDVKVVCLSFLSDSEYLNLVNKTLNLNLKADGATKQMKALLKEKQVFVSTSVSKKYWQNTDHYLLGLTIGKPQRTQFLALKSFYLAYQKSTLSQLSWALKTETPFVNLLPPLLTLYRYNEGTDRTKLKLTILALAKKVNEEEKVNAILKQYE